jgi:hypothetical protein
VKPLTGSDFPELRQVFAGYLNEDFSVEYGTPAAALRAFHEEASTAERRRFSTEAAEFLDRTSDLPFGEVRDHLARLGCRWAPPSRDALVALLAGGRGRPKRRR